MIKKCFPFLVLFLLFASGTTVVAQAVEQPNEAKQCRSHGGKTDSDTGPDWCKNEGGTCSPEMRGRCGKRRGDWYGARQPVATAAEARTLLQNYFAGRDYTVSDLSEKKWGFRGDIVDKSGKIIDRVMIDKRSGRIRSLN